MYVFSDDRLTSCERDGRAADGRESETMVAYRTRGRTEIYIYGHRAAIGNCIPLREVTGWRPLMQYAAALA